MTRLYENIRDYNAKVSQDYNYRLVWELLSLILNILFR